MTNSHVTFQGYPYEFCTDETSIPYHPPDLTYRSMQLDVVFYETPLYNGSVVGNIMSPLLIQNTSFMNYAGGFGNTYEGSDIFRILQFSRNLIYQVTIENVAWCHNTIFFAQVIHHIKWFHLLYTKSLVHLNQKLHLKVNNVHVQHNIYGGADVLWQLNCDSLVEFINTDVTISGSSYFGENSGGSVIEVVSSNLTITGDLTVRDGYSYKGGGIRLDSYSYLFLKEPLIAWFINNKAQQGSAIYAPVHTNTGGISSSKTTSAIQILPIDFCSSSNLTDLNITLYFNNYFNDTGLGNSLYAPDFNFLGKQISPYFLFDSDTRVVNSWYAYTALIDGIFKGSEFDRFTSLSNGVCIGIMGQELNCFYIDYNYYSGTNPCGNGLVVSVYPGQNAVSLVCADNKDYQITYNHNQEKVIRQISCEAKPYHFWKSTLLSNNLSLSFYYPAPYYYKAYCIALSNMEFSRSIPFLNVNILYPCPYGFNLTEDGICDCIDALKNHSFTCDINTLRFTSPSNVWIDYLNQFRNHDSVIFLSTNCPPNYCKSNMSLSLSFTDTLSNSFCLHNRTKILCGQCMNRSAVFGSDACIDCSNLYLLTLPVYALAGLFLVIILFALRLTVATGTINGVIFYANILDLSMNVLSLKNTQFHLSPLRIIISLLNLNLGFPLCLYDGMTTAGKAGFQFVFPIYLWSIALGLIIASKFSLRLSNVISDFSVQVLATLFYLSFSKLIHATIYIFSSSTVFLIIENGFSYDNMTVWYYDGSVYGSGVHGFLLFLAAVFIVFFILPYTVLLTFSYCFMGFRIVNKFRPFLDAYGGPFKDKWRFWFGLRLWITALLLSVDGVLRGTNLEGMLMAHLVIIMVFILVQAHVRPFRNQLVGVLDIFFMLNYWLIIVFYFQFDPAKITFLAAYIFLIGSAIAALAMIMLSHLFYYWVYMKKPDFFSALKMKLSSKIKKYEVVVNVMAEDSDEDLFEAAENRDQVADTY